MSTNISYLTPFYLDLFLNPQNCDFKARIKKIMQSDEEIGKVAAAVPVVISKSLEMFMETLVKKTYDITMKRGAKTLTPSHM